MLQFSLMISLREAGTKPVRGYRDAFVYWFTHSFKHTHVVNPFKCQILGGKTRQQISWRGLLLVVPSTDETANFELKKIMKLLPCNICIEKAHNYKCSVWWKTEHTMLRAPELRNGPWTEFPLCLLLDTPPPLQ